MKGLSHNLRKELKDEFQDKEYAHAYVNEFLNTQIATQIRVLRERRGLTQEQLALMADMKQSRISLLENVFYDKWSISTLKKLAEALDVSLKVSFEKFSDRITDMQNLDRESLERLSREDDLASEETEPQFDKLPSNVFRIADYMADYDSSIIENEDATSRGSRPESDINAQPDQDEHQYVRIIADRGGNNYGYIKTKRKETCRFDNRVEYF